MSRISLHGKTKIACSAILLAFASYLCFSIWRYEAPIERDSFFPGMETIDFLRYSWNLNRSLLAALVGDRVKRGEKFQSAILCEPFRFAPIFPTFIFPEVENSRPLKPAAVRRLAGALGFRSLDAADAGTREAEFYWQFGAVKEALDALKRGVTADTGNTRARYKLGLVYKKMGLNKEAIREFETVIGDLRRTKYEPHPSTEPGTVAYGHAFLAIADKFMAERRFEEAARNYREALQFDPWLTPAAKRLSDLEGKDPIFTASRFLVTDALNTDPIVGVSYDDLDVEMGGVFYLVFYSKRSHSNKIAPELELVGNLISNPSFELDQSMIGLPRFWEADIYDASPSQHKIARYSSGFQAAILYSRGKIGIQSIPVRTNAKDRYLQIGSVDSRNAGAHVGRMWLDFGTSRGYSYLFTGSTHNWVTVGEVIAPPARTSHCAIWNLIYGESGEASFDTNILVDLTQAGKTDN